jgi:Transposase and inactivated derivatives, IS30 family
MKKIYSQKDLSYGDWDAEFDTVIGKVGGKTLLTIVLPISSILIARLMPKKDQACVLKEFNKLEKILKNNREMLLGQGGIWWFFRNMLTDRGSEMSDFYRLEESMFPIVTPEGNEALWCRTRVFYCDPYSSWQKPHVEEAHTLLRRVLPKGTHFEDLTQREVNLVCSHINSYSREKLGGATPFDCAPPGFNAKLIRALGMKEIDADEVNLKPRLLDR